MVNQAVTPQNASLSPTSILTVIYKIYNRLHKKGTNEIRHCYNTMLCWTQSGLKYIVYIIMSISIVSGNIVFNW